MERDEVLNKFYNDSCNEDVRLDSKHGQVELLTTTKYIEEYLKPDSKILEVGAATGRYSLYYAKKGFNVTAIEYVDHNVEILKSKITDEMDIIAEQGDGCDLSRFEDNTFDIPLVFAALYHHLRIHQPVLTGGQLACQR